uniref:Bimodular protein, putative n=1 Tax=Brugia malayi TaxID=6279 RepID=A0A8L7SM74_BRUMA
MNNSSFNSKQASPLPPPTSPLAHSYAPPLPLPIPPSSPAFAPPIPKVPEKERSSGGNEFGTISLFGSDQRKLKKQKMKTIPTKKGKLIMFAFSICFGVSLFTFLFAVILFIVRV